MLNQSLTQKQQCKILPQQLRMLSLFHLNGQELILELKNELEENPFLEMNDQPLEEFAKTDEPEDYKDYEEYCYEDNVKHAAEHQNYFNDADAPTRQFADSVNFKEELLEQVPYLELNAKQEKIAEFIIGSLNDDGLLTATVEELADDLSFKMHLMVNENDVAHVIEKVKTLEPAGIAASDIRECMILQLKRMHSRLTVVKKATLLLEKYYSELAHRNYGKIKDVLDIDEEEMELVIKLITALKLKPIASTVHEEVVNHRLYPDYIITANGNEIIVQLANTKSEAISVNSSLHEEYKLTGCRNSDEKAARQYLKNKLDAANWFVNAIKQREGTMLKVMRVMVEFQKEYFAEGDETRIKPMVLRQIAEIAGVDISTVSRITCNKYADTHFGMVHLKQLFSEGLESADGEIVSNKVIRMALAEAVNEENKKTPYSDQQLVAILGNKGLKVARRTVAKYRDQLSIPVAQLRMAVNY